ncbi:MAG: hypothetical protein M3004_09370 [Bacteroidota bacterium]|nr:hypothetical protein [Bacteroidota bacterium]
MSEKGFTKIEIGLGKRKNL